MNENLAIFERGIRIQNRKIRILILVLALVPVGGLIWGLSDGGQDRAMAKMIAMCGLGILGVVAWLASTFRRHKGLVALEKPEDIVWFFPTRQANGVVWSLGVVFADGRIEDVPIPGPKDEAAAMDAMSALAPDAMRGGYRPELIAMIRQNPAALRRILAGGGEHRLTWDDTEICWTPRGGSATILAWDDLRKVVIRTTDQGPGVDDVFIVLTGSTSQCVIPQSLDSSQALLERLGKLPGFSHEAVIHSMSSTENDEFLCWQS